MIIITGTKSQQIYTAMPQYNVKQIVMMEVVPELKFAK